MKNFHHAGGIAPGGSGRPVRGRLHRIVKILLVLSVFCFTLGGTAQAGRRRLADGVVPRVSARAETRDRAWSAKSQVRVRDTAPTSREPLQRR